MKRLSPIKLVSPLFSLHMYLDRAGHWLICAGLMEIPVSVLQMPLRGSRLLREPDPIFISNLKDNMLRDPAGPGAAPLALFCMDKTATGEFNPKHKTVYKYEVLGGLHTFLAKSQLAQEVPDDLYMFVNADVYVGLTDDEALRLAVRHNQNSHFTHKVTHRDLVSNHLTWSLLHSKGNLRFLYMYL